MRRLKPQEILSLFDEFSGAAVSARTGALVALSYPQVDARSESAGMRNQRLMQIRGANLGRSVSCLTHCPACDEVLELKIDTLDFRGPPAIEKIFVDHQGRSLAFRLPTVVDIEAAARSHAPLARLMSGCAINLPPDIDIEDAELLAKVSDAFDAADPLGRIVIETQCPTCQVVARPVLDPADFVWREFASIARRLENEVHLLARAYGWAENEILSIPEGRRQRYVERVSS